MGDNFYKSSFYLTISTLATGALGFIFIIIVSKEIGAEGMGLYGLIMPIYDLFCCFICGGMTSAISKKSAEFSVNLDYYSLNSLVDVSLIFDLFWGSFLGILLFISSPYISTSILKDSRSLYSLMLICPSMIFVSLSSILKGYFYGTKKVLIPAIIDIFEKAIRIFVISLLIYKIKTVDIKYNVTFAYTALLVGEFISFIFLFFNYMKVRVKRIKKGKESKAQILFDTLRISFPLCITGFLTTLFSSISSIMIPRRLMRGGFTYSSALSLVGKFKGMALTIVNFPIFIVIPVCIMLIPDISQDLSLNNKDKIRRRIYEVALLAFITGIISFYISYRFHDKLGLLFYKRNDLGDYIKYASITCPITFLAATTYGILNGLGKQNIILRNSLVTSVIEFAILYFFTAIPRINIYSVEITIIFSSFISLILNTYEINLVIPLFNSYHKKFWN